MPAVDEITIRGFKSIKALEGLKLNPINVLVGANGSGKSNFIEVFSLLRDVARDRIHEFVARSGGADRILHFGSRTTDQLEVTIIFDDGEAYELVLTGTTGDSFSRRSVTGRSALSNMTGRPAYDDESTSGDVRITDPWVPYHFHDTGRASPMKRLGDLYDNRALRTDGSNLAAFLFLLQSIHPESYRTIRRTVQMVAPFFDDFDLAPQALNPEKIILEWRHKGSDSYFNAAALSDGTLRFIALATVLLQPQRLKPSVFLLDEPELGLHPYAITLLASLVKQASIDSQVIMATQSPILLDHFEPDDVIVSNRVHGEAIFERLDAERLAAWLEDYSMGELWEKNEIGGRPARE
ncbi:MAG: AAA family ATPase [Chloroflexi bacterium]|nr:AAA family ATPase [Chloroflexota bacterium]